ncbi:hypothetical protein [Otariodibacter sp.]|uniref:hypothetical protein n=1 Tax=Otariodibacter sp. TaxID=3030919 RepID=UPI0026047A9A|nr:hypothetical protein [Otariodibacter sp.]
MKSNKPTREERIARALLLNGSFSEREGVTQLNITSGRNEISNIERKLNIKVNRVWEKTADGLGQYYRYSIADKEQAYKMIQFTNTLTQARNAEPFNATETRAILARFKGKI